MPEIWPHVEAWLTSPEARRFVLVVTRMLAIVVLSPIFGGEALPRRLRLGLALLLAFALSPPFPSQQTVASAESLPFAVLVAKEGFVGLVFSVFLKLAFEMLAAAGAMIDASRGASMATLLDPSSRQQNSLLATFLHQALLVLFFAVDGHEALLRALDQSLVLVPPEAGLPATLAASAGPSAMLGLCGELFLAALQAAAPAVAVLFLVDLGFALVSRAAPQMQVYFLGLALKATLGLGVLLLVLRGSLPRLLSIILKTIDGLIGG